MGLAHYILFSVVATVFGGMFLTIGICFIYVCYLTVLGYPMSEGSDEESNRGGLSFIQTRTPPPLRHILVLNPEGNPLFGYRLSDVKSNCASFKSSLRGSFQNRLDLEEGGGENREVVNPLMGIASQSSKEIRPQDTSQTNRPTLAEIREWRTM